MQGIKVPHLYKSITGLLLISSLFLHASCRLGVFAYFYINRAYIAQELCINRFEPASDCAGSCQLDTMLGQLGEEEEQLPDYLFNSREIQLYYGENFSFAIQPIAKAPSPKFRISNTVKHYNRNSMGIFKPPRHWSYTMLGGI